MAASPPNTKPLVSSRHNRRKWISFAVLAAIVILLGSEFLMSGIRVGDKAPSLTGVAHTGQSVSLDDYRGKQAVVVYFYPKDDTPGCTTQACSFRDSYEDFVKAGAVVIGISSDSNTKHREFAERRQLPFLLLADEDGAMRTAFGVPKTLGLFPGRVTYVIDRDGIVQHVFNSQLNAAKHVTEALQVVRRLSSQ